MALGLLLVGLVLIVSAIRGTHGQLWTLVVNDMTGAGATHGFIVWLAAIVAIGAIGFYRPLRTPSHLLLGLIVVVIFLVNGGVWQQVSQTFTQGIPQGTAPADPTATALPAAIPVQVSQAGGGGGILGALSGAVGTATNVVKLGAAAGA